MTLPIRRPWPRTGRCVQRYSASSWWIYRLGPRRWETREFTEIGGGTNCTSTNLVVFPTQKQAHEWCSKRVHQVIAAHEAEMKRARSEGRLS